jgi:hypothetical protein
VLRVLVTPGDLYLPWHRFAPDARKMFAEAGPVMALLSDAPAIPEIPGTVDLFAHQIGLAVSAFPNSGAERMLRPTVGVPSRLWETAGFYADLVYALAERPAFAEPIARRLSWSRDPKKRVRAPQ